MPGIEVHQYVVVALILFAYNLVFALMWGIGRDDIAHRDDERGIQFIVRLVVMADLWVVKGLFKIGAGIVKWFTLTPDERADPEDGENA